MGKIKNISDINVQTEEGELLLIAVGAFMAIPGFSGKTQEEVLEMLYSIKKETITLLEEDEIVLTEEDKELVRTAHKELSNLFPIEANHCSRLSLFSTGRDSGLVSRELFKKAEQYYGKLWSYVGD